MEAIRTASPSPRSALALAPSPSPSPSPTAQRRVLSRAPLEGITEAAFASKSRKEVEAAIIERQIVTHNDAIPHTHRPLILIETDMADVLRDEKVAAHIGFQCLTCLENAAATSHVAFHCLPASQMPAHQGHAKLFYARAALIYACFCCNSQEHVTRALTSLGDKPRAVCANMHAACESCAGDTCPNPYCDSTTTLEQATPERCAALKIVADAAHGVDSLGKLCPIFLTR